MMPKPNIQHWKALFPLALLLLQFSHCRISTRVHHRQHAVEITNDAAQRIAVDWYNPDTQKTMDFAHVNAGESVRLNSFSNHTFVVHYDNETCIDQYCRSTVIVVNDNDNQVVTVKDDLQVEHKDDTTYTKLEVEDIVQKCKKEAKRYLAQGYPSKAVLKRMNDCVQHGTADLMQKAHDEKMFQASLLVSMADKLEDYTCKDKAMQTTEAQDIQPWTYRNVTRNVHLLHERQASKIHLLENFISPAECAAIQEAAQPKLHRGTVADGAGGSKLSDHRKAMQGGVRIPWELEEQGNPLANVFRRIYAYTNHATGFGIEVKGQEDLMSIQYFGRGEGDEAPDRYKPHCDGDCNGLPHKTGGRVATMVMYCDTEGLVGGATNFGHAGVYVKPKVGAAAFFSYLDPDTHIHETGFTTHSGCPVVEGVKRIAVHWMRIGVSEERPWDSFDTNNVHKSDCDDDE